MQKLACTNNKKIDILHTGPCLQDQETSSTCTEVCPKVVKGKKYFFKNRFEKFQNDFSNFETPSLAVSKFRNAKKENGLKKFRKLR